jgi:hypothetical protein
MTQLLAYGSNNVFTGTVTQAGTTLTVVVTTGTVGVGSLISITGFLPVVVYAASGSNWTVNLSQTVPSGTAASASKYTVQNLLNTFFNGVNTANYSLLFSAVQGAEDSIINPTYGTAPGCGLRVLSTIDDGSTVFDTSKTTNQYVNYSNKIKIASATVNTSNAVTVDGTSPATATLTIGSAGGNNINENHMSRPEILVALLSNNGIGYASRYSTSVNANLFYLAQRVGLSTEEPVGFIRISVPTV